MAPPIEHFPPEELEARAQFDAKGRYRKGGVDLEKCKLMEMLQYDCWVERRVSQPFVKCRPLVRMFRKYVASVSRLGRFRADWPLPL
ncbi:hypothetical protein IWX90DRAFT_424789 [Phyllosticta citrichinensis]|uniref:Uncharacterized protein n=1 Tax=Phyllosticta citrichinensis TaxID=1130410 RepID=A0ABR1Y386_9PEZI